MAYLYHHKPGQKGFEMRGTTLYPLNALKRTYPDVYEKQAQKYTGRAHILQLRIPILDCFWNDVLHFTAVHPEDIQKALVDAGGSGILGEYYQIDPKSLGTKDTVVYLYTRDTHDLPEEEIIPYNPDDVATFSVMPQATKEYYAESVGKGEKPLLYHLIPHILYKGSVDVTNLPFVSV